jgi:hypothetical protein
VLFEGAYITRTHNARKNNPVAYESCSDADTAKKVYYLILSMTCGRFKKFCLFRRFYDFAPTSSFFVCFLNVKLDLDNGGLSSLPVSDLLPDEASRTVSRTNGLSTFGF